MSAPESDSNGWAASVEDDQNVDALHLDNGDLVIYQIDNEDAWLQGPAIKTEAMR